MSLPAFVVQKKSELISKALVKNLVEIIDALIADTVLYPEDPLVPKARKVVEKARTLSKKR